MITLTVVAICMTYSITTYQRNFYFAPTASEIERMNPGTIVFKQGDRGLKFYIILRGEVRLFRRRLRMAENEELVQYQKKSTKELKEFFEIEQISKLKQGNCFGELALVDQHEQRQASVQTTQQTYFLTLDRNSYNNILNHQKEGIKYLEFFASMHLFQNWNVLDIKTLFDLSQSKQYNLNNFVYQQNDISDFIYLVKRGEFQVSVNVSCYVTKDEQLNFNTMQPREEEVKIQIKQPQNLVAKMSEKKKLQRTLLIGLVSKGECFGQEEMLDQIQGQVKLKNRVCSVKCVSSTASVYIIKREDFLTQFNYKDPRLGDIQQIIDKKRQYREEIIQNMIRSTQNFFLPESLFAGIDPILFDKIKKNQKSNENSQDNKYSPDEFTITGVVKARPIMGGQTTSIQKPFNVLAVKSQFKLDHKQKLNHEEPNQLASIHKQTESTHPHDKQYSFEFLDPGTIAKIPLAEEQLLEEEIQEKSPIERAFERELKKSRSKLFSDILNMEESLQVAQQQIKERKQTLLIENDSIPSQRNQMEVYPSTNAQEPMEQFKVISPIKNKGAISELNFENYREEGYRSQFSIGNLNYSPESEKPQSREKQKSQEINNEVESSQEQGEFSIKMKSIIQEEQIDSIITNKHQQSEDLNQNENLQFLQLTVQQKLDQNQAYATTEIQSEQKKKQTIVLSSLQSSAEDVKNGMFIKTELSEQNQNLKISEVDLSQQQTLINVNPTPVKEEKRFIQIQKQNGIMDRKSMCPIKAQMEFTANLKKKILSDLRSKATLVDYSKEQAQFYLEQQQKEKRDIYVRSFMKRYNFKADTLDQLIQSVRGQNYLNTWGNKCKQEPHPENSHQNLNQNDYHKGQGLKTSSSQPHLSEHSRPISINFQNLNQRKRKTHTLMEETNPKSQKIDFSNESSNLINLKSPLSIDRNNQVESMSFTNYPPKHNSMATLANKNESRNVQSPENLFEGYFQTTRSQQNFSPNQVSSNQLTPRISSFAGSTPKAAGPGNQHIFRNKQKKSFVIQENSHFHNFFKEGQVLKKRELQSYDSSTQSNFSQWTNTRPNAVKSVQELKPLTASSDLNKYFFKTFSNMSKVNSRGANQFFEKDSVSAHQQGKAMTDGYQTARNFIQKQEKRSSMLDLN